MVISMMRHDDRTRGNAACDGGGGEYWNFLQPRAMIVCASVPRPLKTPFWEQGLSHWTTGIEEWPGYYYYYYYYYSQ